MSLFVSARQLRQWSESTPARSTLPHVVRRLVQATLDPGDIRRIDFPAGESVQRPGFDGVVECGRGNAWVPPGRSVWELSVESGPGTKAGGDYRKRVQGTDRDTRASTTYVCLTARHWQKKNEWAAGRRLEGDWRDVRAYDADDLEQWVEAAPPGIATWVGQQLGSRPEGVDEVGRRWDAISSVVDCRLAPQVFLAGRERNVERLLDWLRGEAKELRFVCRSPGEVVDFFCAAVAATDEAERSAVRARAVVVDSERAWHALRDASAPSILVPNPALQLRAEEVARAVANGHHVLVAAEPSLYSDDRESELRRADEHGLGRALEESGLPPVRAEQLARSAGGSLQILKNRLCRDPLAQRPPWESRLSPEVVAACLLLGGWSDTAADQSAFAGLAGRPYAECEAELRLAAGFPDPLLWHADAKWRLVSKDHAWDLHGSRVPRAALERFESLAVEILADDDPAYRLPVDERPFAGLRGARKTYSCVARRHLAETLAFLGTFADRLRETWASHVRPAVDRAVSDVLPCGVSWHRWASLGVNLSFLAEASPRVFLRAVRDDLRRPDSQLAWLLRDEEPANPLFGGCLHAGLLWALECLAWSNRLLPEVTGLLLELAARDEPERRWANRPSASLSEIFRAWMPQTAATLEERVAALDASIGRDEPAAWAVLLDLLPGHANTVSHPTPRPCWRDWADGWERGATPAEHLEFDAAVGERVVRLAGTDPARWRQVFERLGDVPESARDTLLDAAEAFAATSLPDEDRRPLAELLSGQVNRHRAFPKTRWALPSAALDRLDGVLEQLQPRDVVLKHAWLFEQWPDRYFARADDVNDRLTAIQLARSGSLREILDARGFSGVEALLAACGSPAVVGETLARLTGDEYLANVVPALLEDEPRQGVADSFVGSRFAADGWNWADVCVRRCATDQAKANLLRSLPFEPQTWDRAEASGEEVSRLYWRNCPAFNPRLESLDVARATGCLLSRARPAAALDLLTNELHLKRHVSPEMLLAPLEALLAPRPKGCRREARRCDGYDVRQVIAALQRRPDVDEVRLARVEWSFIRLLEDDPEHAPRTLHRRLAVSPAFFNEVLGCCFPSRKEPGELAEPTEQQRQAADSGFRLLHCWATLPGTREDGTVDEDLLRKWCVAVRRIAEDEGRVQVCDTQIGNLFARSEAEDEDGAWPCRAVRRVAEGIGTESLTDGMHCGIRHRRGVVCRGSGGDQERTLAERFRARADRIRFDSPLVARVLDDVAEDYDREAGAWDEKERWES